MFPSKKMTLAISAYAYWEKGGVLQETFPINTIHLSTSNDITTVGSSKYFNKYITKPTYINVLEHIMLTAEAGYQDVLKYDYRLVLTAVTIEAKYDEVSGWQAAEETGYEIDNATTYSPVLARFKDVGVSSVTKTTSVAVNNVGASDLAITSFTVKGKLWYADYNSDLSQFDEEVKQFLPDNSLIYDSNMWSASYSTETNTYTFTRVGSGYLHYISGGSSMSLISGVKIPYQADLESLANGGSMQVHDLWCSLEVQITGCSDAAYTSSGSYSGVETIAEGYNSAILDGQSSYIYIRNNTKQTIASVTISNLTLWKVTSLEGNPRDHVDVSADANFNYSLTNRLSGAAAATQAAQTAFGETTIANIRPGETYVLYEINPEENAVIGTYSITVQVSSGNSASGLRLVANTKTGNVDVINDSEQWYEFRLKSKSNFASVLVNSAEFECTTTADANGYYYAYYKGAICAGQFIRVLNNVTIGSGLEIDGIVHADDTNAATRYVASNYTTWNPPAAWLSAMKTIFG